MAAARSAVAKGGAPVCSAAARMRPKKTKISKAPRKSCLFRHQFGRSPTCLANKNSAVNARGGVVPMRTRCPKPPQQCAFVPGRGMSDYLIISGLGPEHCGLHLPVQCDNRDKRERQNNGRFNPTTMRF